MSLSATISKNSDDVLPNYFFIQKKLSYNSFHLMDQPFLCI